MGSVFTKANGAGSAWSARRALGAYLLFLILTGLAACGGGGGPGSPDAGTTPTPPAPSVGQATLGAAGGSITGPDGTLIEVPAQALSADVTIRIARDSTGAPAIPNGWKALSPIYTITPHIEPLNVPVGLTIPFDATQRTTDTTLAIAVANPGEDWQWLPATDTPSGAKAMTRHFSFVAVVQNKGYATVELIAPVPLQPWPQFSGSGTKSWILNAPMTLEVRATYTPTPSWNNCAEMSYFLHVSNWGRVGTTGWTGTRVLQYVIKKTAPLPTGVELATGTTTSFFVPLDSSVNGISEFMFSASCTQAAVPVASGAVYGTNYGLLSDILVDIPVGADSPSITQQPQSTSVTAGQSASFSLAASAPNSLSVSWERSNDNGQTWSGVQGGTTGLNVASTVLGDSGAQFRAQVCNVMVLGAPVCVSSAVATLTVNPAPVPPVFTQQPAAVTVLAGQTASFSAMASGTPAPKVQWMQGSGASAVAVGTPCQGTGTQTACSFTTAGLTAAQSGTSFFARASNSAATVDSATATVTVTPAPVSPSIPSREPANVAVTVGGSATFTIHPSGTAPLSIQWRHNGLLIPGANSTTYTFGNAQLSNSGDTFTVDVSNSVGGASNTATLTVTPLTTPPVTPPVSSGSVQAGRLAVWAYGLLGVMSNGQLMAIGETLATPGNAANDVLSSPGVLAGLSSISSISTVTGANGRPGCIAALDGNGRLFTWSNYSASFNYVWDCMGRPYVGTLNSPTQVPNLEPITQVVLNVSHHVYALGASGSVYAWGSAVVDANGNAVIPASSTPVRVSGLAGITRIWGGVGTGYALKSDGTLWAWGDNSSGQLGDANASGSPAQVVGIPGPVVAVAAASGYADVLTSDGSVYVLGNVDHGLVTVPVAGANAAITRATGLPPLSHVVATSSHTLALLPDGTAYSWGDNSYGQLGRNVGGGIQPPGPIVGVSGVVSIATGYEESALMLNNGQVMRWGEYSVNAATSSFSFNLTPTNVAGFDLIP